LSTSPCGRGVPESKILGRDDCVIPARAIFYATVRTMSLPPYLILEKAVGETPLACVETCRARHPELTGVPLAYAGRLDPMASGTLLILVGDTCKQQADWHNLDKAYDFSILFGISSDTHDVLGRLTTDPTPPVISATTINAALSPFTGEITLPYPHFSSKTVNGKPLHTWTLENRLSEITIPTKTSTVYSLTLTSLETITRDTLVSEALKKINTIPPVTDPRKALGNDFRRSEIIPDWHHVASSHQLPPHYHIATLHCIASSGTYMRTLAHEIARHCGTMGLAWHIHRSMIGIFNPETQTWRLPEGYVP